MKQALLAARDRLRGQAGLTLLEHEPLAPHTSFGIGGPADLLLIPHEIPALLAAQRLLADFESPPVYLGLGTNVLISDAGIRGVVIKVAQGLVGLAVDGPVLTAAAGESLQAVCHLAADAGLAGLEFAGGIPGTMGGAVLMNAGAHGGEMAQVVEWAEVALDGELQRFDREALQFGYRQSLLRSRSGAVVRAAVRLVPGSPEVTHQRLYEILERRCARQPVTQRSAGCIFKRPPGDFAGRLVEAAGCKGLRLGDAAISTKHANFIVNLGNASAREVLALIETVRERVYDQFGVSLETEVCWLGESDGV
ncbi:MAG: UDP-N-acetylmuramate dehydrogenase [candidate division WS1 bacterium]|jgi:UDP-N-acetylmuramate dehydrogenase|nr:UDP-N-acetylmuramate dehydrogenase [candidate division WS1 bacterium]